MPNTLAHRTGIATCASRRWWSQIRSFFDGTGSSSVLHVTCAAVGERSARIGTHGHAQARRNGPEGGTQFMLRRVTLPHWSPFGAVAGSLCHVPGSDPLDCRRWILGAGSDTEFQRTLLSGSRSRRRWRVPIHRGSPQECRPRHCPAGTAHAASSPLSAASAMLSLC